MPENAESDIDPEGAADIRATAAPGDHPEIAHLYVHVPFCPTVCPFCSFHVMRRRDDQVAAYLARLDAELATVAERWPTGGALRTVYLGGGTPSHLSDRELEALLQSIRRRFDVAPDAEVCLESHPLNIDASRPRVWRELGFTRVSVGVQSTQDAVLRALGRPYDAATARRALDAVLAVDGWTVNADLIVAAPAQDLRAELEVIAASGVHHLATYTLTIEPGTPFDRRGVAVDEHDERRAIDTATQLLPAYGLQRYEVSNHSRPGRRCEHNLAYWRGRFWFGAGPSATAHLPVGPACADGSATITDGPSRALHRNADFERWLQGSDPDVEPLDALAAARSDLLTGLRLREGFQLGLLDELDRLDDASPPRRGRVESLEEQGLVRIADGWLCLSDDGWALADRLTSALW